MSSGIAVPKDPQSHPGRIQSVLSGGKTGKDSKTNAVELHGGITALRRRQGDSHQEPSRLAH